MRVCERFHAGNEGVPIIQKRKEKKVVGIRELGNRVFFGYLSLFTLHTRMDTGIDGNVTRGKSSGYQGYISFKPQD